MSEEVINYPRGAEWRKWDLHIHSDASDGHMKCDQIIKVAISRRLSVIALTDHHTAKNVDLLRRLGKEAGLAVIAGIEFRTEYGSRSVHIIGLFPETYGSFVLDSKNLQALVLDPLELSEARIASEGRRHLKATTPVSDEDAFRAGLPLVQVEFKRAADLIHKYGGLVVPHSGSKENSLDREMRHEGKQGVRLYESLGPVKQELFEDGYIDICEIRKRCDDEAFYLEKFGKASFTCSDAHSSSEIGASFTWIKADPTFEGLRQVTKEPSSRVLISDCPDLLKKIELSPTKYLTHVVIEPEEDYDGSNGRWFDHVLIELNPELVAIIGNKGSGKSAITDMLGLCTNCRREDHFSFLRSNRFRQKGYADQFRAGIGWASGDDQNRKNLMTRVDSTHPESAKYLPQGYFEELCNGPDGLEQLKREINEVVFQHVPDELKLNQSTFEDFLNEKSEAINAAISNAKRQLKEDNRKVIELEKMRNPDHRQTVENELAQKQEELRSLKPPKSVKNPSKSKTIKKQEQLVLGKIDESEKAITELKAAIKRTRTKRGDLNTQVENLSQFRREIEQHARTLRRFIAEKRALFKDVPEIKVDEIMTFEFKTDTIDTLVAEKKKTMSSLDQLLSETSVPDKDGAERSLVVKLTGVQKAIELMQTQLNRPGKAYQDFRKAKSAWEAKKQDIIGDQDTPGTLEYMKRRAQYLEKRLEEDLQEARRKREQTVREIYQHKREMIAIYRDIQEHLGQTLRNYAGRMEGYPIRIVAELFVRPDFKERLLGYINKTVVGNYKGVQEAQRFLAALMERFDINAEEGLLGMLQAIIGSLESEERQGDMLPRNIDDQVDDMGGLYDYLFGLDYIGENYQLKLGEKSLETLSPGEKGALLLVFYLLLDKNDIPLILDQPEDNLDNQSVYQILVPYIKEAKKRRQIVMITHNPNLAVAADAEQVIRVDIRKDQFHEFSWVSGGIENPRIKKAIVDVLEGTMPAFRNRSGKYESLEQ